MKKKITLLTIFLLILTANSTVLEAGQWQFLFNGKDLTGWKQLNGVAKYYVEDGVLVGQAVLDDRNSFLCTEKTFSNFILEYDLKIPVGLNSGVQIRSESKNEYKNSQVFGYQVECDTSDRKWSGGIYDESRRGWIYPLDANPAGRNAFKNGQWNKFRVEAVGNRIRTFVNGVPCADLIDNMTTEGFIGLQVHAIYEKSDLVGQKFYWKNIRIITKNPKKHVTKTDNCIRQVNLIPNYLSEQEKAQGWRFLWDGKTTDGWRSAKQYDFPEKGWIIENGELSVQSSGGAESAYGGDIITVDKYRNFELKLDFKISKGANSGIKYFVDPELNKGKGSAIGCEFQILDDENHPDAKKGVNGNRTMGSLYDIIKAEAVPQKIVHWDDWNLAYILVNGDHVEHWLNNVKVVEYERRNQMWRALVAYSKYKIWPNFGEADQGHILLQDHGDEIHFRNIKIRKIK